MLNGKVKVLSANELNDAFLYFLWIFWPAETLINDKYWFFFNLDDIAWGFKMYWKIVNSLPIVI